MSNKPLPQKIWLAGLGAIARAEREGEKWLEELMVDGQAYELDKKEELDNVLLAMTDTAQSEKKHLKQRISNIEKAFENRVSKTLMKLGMVSNKELDALSKRLSELEKAIEKK